MEFSTPVTDAEWEHWLTDPRYDPYRVLLVEIRYRPTNNSIGYIRLASEPFFDRLADFPRAWDDWLIRHPVLRSSVGGARTLGEIDAINQDDSLDWLNLDVLGTLCTWYYGDRRWIGRNFTDSTSQFRTIAWTRCTAVRHLGGRSYRFELSDDSAFLKRRTSPSEFTVTGTHEYAINYARESTGTPNVTFVNVPQARIDAQATMLFTPNRTKESTLEQLLAGINAMLRTNDQNHIEIVIPAPVGSPDYTVTEDDIVERGVRMISVRQPYADLDIVYANDDTVRYDTGADDLHAEGVFKIETAFIRNASSQALADTIAAEYVALYGAQLRTWQIRMRHLAQALRIGHRIDVEHEDWTGTGVVTDIRRSPTAKYSLVEVEER